MVYGSTWTYTKYMEARVRMLIPTWFSSSCMLFVFSEFRGFGLRLKALGGIPFLSGVKFQMECTNNHVWGPPGAREMPNFVKHVFFAKDALGKNKGLKEH